MIFQGLQTLELSTGKPMGDGVFFGLEFGNGYFKGCVCEGWLFLHIDLFAINFNNAVNGYSVVADAQAICSASKKIN